MGLYYTPQPPHIGSAQPLEGKKLTPPAGPVPQNPPFNGGSRINPAILGCWAAVAVAAAVLPTLPRQVVPSSPSATEVGVIFDKASTTPATGLGGTGFTDSTNLTIANNPNRALIVTINCSGSPSTFSATWDGVAMTQLGIITQSTFDTTTVMFGLRNPNVGTKSLVVAWSNTSDFVASAASFYNVDQTSDAAAFKNVTQSQNTVSPASITVNTFGNGDKVLASYTLGAFVTTFTAVNNTPVYNVKNNSMAGAGNRTTASVSPSVTMTATESANQPWTALAVAIQPVRTPYVPFPLEEIITAWRPPYQAPIVGPKLPPQPAAVAAFPFRGSRVPTEVLVAWTPAPFFQVVQELLNPPIAAPQNPPFMGGAEVAQAILNAWIPPPPAPIVAINLDPPIPGPVAQNPPFMGGAEVQQAILNAWIPPPPAPIVAINLDPPIAGPVPSNPPFMGGSEIQQAILNAWIPPPWIPVVADNLTPPSAPVVTFVPPARFPTEILNAWQVVTPAAIVAQNLTPPSGPVAAFTPPSRFMVEVFDAWVPLPFAPITARNLTPPAGPVTTFPPLGSFVPREVLISWIPPAPMPIVARNLVPPISGPTPDNPPFIGALVPVAMPEDWAPIVARNLTPPSAPPSLPVGGGARVPGEVLINWLPPAPMPVLARNLTPPSGPVASNPPFVGGSRLLLEIQLNWLAKQPGYPPLKAINKTPPSGGGGAAPVLHANPFFVTFGLRPL